MNRSLLRGAALALAIVGTTAACSDFEAGFVGPGDQALAEIFFQLPSEGSGSAAAGPAASVRITGSGGRTLNITEAELVVRELELGQVGGECTDSQSVEQDDGDGCTEISVQPNLLEFPVDRGEVRIANVEVPEADFDRLEFEVQVATNEDQNVLNQAPRLLDHSLKLSGSFDGNGFSVVLAPEAELTLPFGQTVTTEAGSTARLTLVSDLRDWFLRDDGSVIDPRVLEDDPELAQSVRQRVLDSFRVELGPPQ